MLFLKICVATRMSCMIVLIMQILSFMTLNYSFPLSDKIVRLPGQPEVSFQQFSGYITIDEKQERALFYYLVDAEKDPKSKPLVLWLSGGPGCSSVGFGAFIEHGPFKLINGEDLIKNQYSWNKEANILYLESPAGVGFSYSANKSFYVNLNDEITARDSLIFLQRWFDKFPEYKNTDFYITGESYGGHYVPQLVQLIIDSNIKFNLKGIAIGNPLFEFNSDFNSRGLYFWSHGLISDSSYQLVTSVCNVSQYMREGLVLKGVNFTANCYRVAKQVLEEVNNFINEYDVTEDYCNSTILQSQKDIYQAFGILDKKVRLFGPKEAAQKYEDCMEKKVSNYLNRKDVPKALHARLVGVVEWKPCSKVINYDPRDLEIPTIHILRSILRSAGIRALIYSGDQDSIIPFISTRSLVAGVAKELGLNSTTPYRAWFERKQIGGWTQMYGNILSYATIRGASHDAPSTEPARSLVLFKSFLAGKAPPAEPY